MISFYPRVQRSKPGSDQEENELVILHLRQLCETKQRSHLHIGEAPQVNEWIKTGPVWLWPQVFSDYMIIYLKTSQSESLNANKQVKVGCFADTFLWVICFRLVCSQKNSDAVVYFPTSQGANTYYQTNKVIIIITQNTTQSLSQFPSSTDVSSTVTTPDSPHWGPGSLFLYL